MVFSDEIMKSSQQVLLTAAYATSKSRHEYRHRNILLVTFIVLMKTFIVTESLECNFLTFLNIYIDCLIYFFSLETLWITMNSNWGYLVQWYLGRLKSEQPMGSSFADKQKVTEEKTVGRDETLALKFFCFPFICSAKGQAAVNSLARTHSRFQPFFFFYWRSKIGTNWCKRVCIPKNTRHVILQNLWICKNYSINASINILTYNIYVTNVPSLIFLYLIIDRPASTDQEGGENVRTKLCKNNKVNYRKPTSSISFQVTYLRGKSNKTRKRGGRGKWRK